jgi:hypothetical protein
MGPDLADAENEQQEPERAAARHPDHWIFKIVATDGMPLVSTMNNM